MRPVTHTRQHDLFYTHRLLTSLKPKTTIHSGFVVKEETLHFSKKAIF